MNELEMLIDKIMKVHNVYCAVSLKPSYAGNVYKSPKYEVYISKMPDGMSFCRNLTIQGAIDKLTMYLNGRPENVFEELKNKRLQELRERILALEEEIKNLIGD